MLRDYVVFQVDGIAIIGQIFLPGKRKKYPAVCLCHGVPSGNPPEAGDRGYPGLAERICREGFAVLIFNFRGTGDSGGNFDMPGWTRDLQAAVNYLRGLPGIDKSRIFLVGFSAGAAASIYVASKDKRISGVAACASPAEFSFLTNYSEGLSVVERFRRTGIIQDADFPPSVEEWLDGFRQVSPFQHVGGIAPRPLLLIHGSDDDVVPVSHVRRLYKLAGEPKKLIVLEGAGHRLRQDDGAMAAVMEWLKLTANVT